MQGLSNNLTSPNQNWRLMCQPIITNQFTHEIYKSFDDGLDLRGVF